MLRRQHQPTRMFSLLFTHRGRTDPGELSVLIWSVNVSLVRCRRRPRAHGLCSFHPVFFFFLLFLPLFCLSIYSPVSSSCPSDHLPDWSHVSNICWGSEWLYWCLAVRSSRSHGGSFRVLLAAGPGPALMIHTQKTHTHKHKEGLQHKHTLSMHVTIKLLLRRLPVSKHEPTAVCIVCIYERLLTHY